MSEEMGESSNSGPTPGSNTGRIPEELEEQEGMVWEIKKGTEFVESIEKLHDAYSFILALLATVNLIAFLQPPKGWRDNKGDMPPPLNTVSIMYNTGSIEIFAISNSISLYSAISGLLFFLGCSNTGFWSMAATKMPRLGNYSDSLRTEILETMRAYMHHKVLPPVCWRTNLLSSFVAASLILSLTAFIASGLAAASPDERLHYVIIPAIPGCVSVFVFLVIGLRKHRRELKFKERFDDIRTHIICKPALKEPGPLLTHSEQIHPRGDVENNRHQSTTPEERSDQVQTIVWEINMAKGFVASFEKLLAAHAFILSIFATVSLIAFLQPPKGWNERPDDTASHLNAMSVMYNTGSIEAYAIASSLSLYSAISGLLFYIYCSHSSVMPLEDAEVPPKDSCHTHHEIQVLERTRSCFRDMVLPAMNRRSGILSFFLAASLTFSVMAFIASGYAASSPDERLHYVIIPGIPGCIAVLFFLLLAVWNHTQDMKFDCNFDRFWNDLVKMKQIEVTRLDDTVRDALNCSLLDRMCRPRPTGKGSKQPAATTKPAQTQNHENGDEIPLNSAVVVF